MGIIPYNSEEVTIECLPQAVYDVGCKGYSLKDENNVEVEPGENVKTIVLRCNAIIDPEMEEKYDSSIFHRINLPSEKDTPKQRKNNKYFTEKACNAFGVDFSKGINPEDFLDKAAKALVTQAILKDGRTLNNIKNFIVEELDNEIPF